MKGRIKVDSFDESSKRMKSPKKSMSQETDDHSSQKENQVITPTRSNTSLQYGASDNGTISGDTNIHEDILINKILEQCPNADTDDAMCIKDFYCEVCKEKIDLIREAISLTETATLKMVKKYELNECNFSSVCGACQSRKNKLKKELLAVEK